MFSSSFLHKLDNCSYGGCSVWHEVYVHSRCLCSLSEAFEVLVEITYRLTLDSSGVPEQSIAVGKICVCLLTRFAEAFGSEVELLSSPFVIDALTNLPDQPFVGFETRLIQCYSTPEISLSRSRTCNSFGPCTPMMLIPPTSEVRLEAEMREMDTASEFRVRVCET